MIQVVGSGNAVTVRSAGAALPLHGVSQDVPAAPIRTETDILKPRCQAIPFIGRESEVDGIWQWLRSSKSFSIRTIAGRGGSGKTRLGIEILRQMQTEMPEWQAGFLDHEELRECAGFLNQRDFEWEKPTLMVLDYGASCVEPLKTIVRKLGQQLEEPDHKGRPMRVLLLERFADTETGWLSEVIDRSWSRDSADFFEPVVHLEPFGDLEQRYEILRQTVARGAAFHPGVLLAVPIAGSDPGLDRRLLEPKCEDPLVLMMAALTAFSTSWLDALSYSRADLAMRVARREAERIKRNARDRSNENLLLHMAAYVTLCSSLSDEVLIQAASGELQALHGQYEGHARGLAHDLAQALPATGGVVGVSPDIVGEAFVIHVLDTKFGDSAGTVGRAVAQDQGAIAVVIRAVADFHHAGFKAPHGWLSAVVKSAQTADSPELLYAIERVLPKVSVELRETSAEVTQALIGWLENAAEGRTDSGALDSERARLVHNLAIRLSDLGCHDEALAEEAVRLYRQLAAARPDAFLPDLAMSLNNLANMLSALGRREEALAQAEEAVRLRRQLAAARPDAFLPDLAMSLNNLANMLSALGRREEALAQAEEAVRLYRQLAAARPDAFLPDLAGSLNNLTKRLSALGRREEALAQAEEAVRLSRQLAAARPDAFLPDLARSLAVLGNCQESVGQFDSAVSSFHESLLLVAPIFEKYPDALRGLATTIFQLYLRGTKAAGLEPDVELSRRIAETLGS